MFASERQKRQKSIGHLKVQKFNDELYPMVLKWLGDARIGLLTQIRDSRLFQTDSNSVIHINSYAVSSLHIAHASKTLFYHFHWERFEEKLKALAAPINTLIYLMPACLRESVVYQQPRQPIIYPFKLY